MLSKIKSLAKQPTTYVLVLVGVVVAFAYGRFLSPVKNIAQNLPERWESRFGLDESATIDEIVVARMRWLGFSEHQQAAHDEKIEKRELQPTGQLSLF